MADIKISELEPTTDLEGLYTIGSDKNNLSKKVSLQFLKDAANYANEQGDYAKQAGDTVNGNVGVSDYPEFSASKSYVIGDIVRYNGVLYAFTANHAASAWNGNDVKATSINAITSGKLTELESETNKPIDDAYLVHSMADFEQGNISDTTGELRDASTRIRSKDYISLPLLNGIPMPIQVEHSANLRPRYIFYDSNKSFIGAHDYSKNPTIPDNAAYMKLVLYMQPDIDPFNFELLNQQSLIVRVGGTRLLNLLHSVNENKSEINKSSVANGGYLPVELGSISASGLDIATSARARTPRLNDNVSIVVNDGFLVYEQSLFDKATGELLGQKTINQKTFTSNFDESRCYIRLLFRREDNGIIEDANNIVASVQGGMVKKLSDKLSKLEQGNNILANVPYKNESLNGSTTTARILSEFVPIETNSIYKLVVPSSIRAEYILYEDIKGEIVFESSYQTGEVYFYSGENKYIRIYCSKSDYSSSITSEDVSAITLAKANGRRKSLKIAQWNVGLFNRGVSIGTPDAELDATIESLKKVMTEENADIFIANEYVPQINNGDEGKPLVDTYETLLKQFYPYRFSGGYYIGIFSKYPIVAENITLQTGSGRTFVKGVVMIDNLPVGFVACHSTPFSAEDRKSENAEFVAAMSEFSAAFVAGDMNTGNNDEDATSQMQQIQPFIDAGYTLGNRGYWGEIPTYPSTKQALDNIIVKGMTLDNYVVLEDKSVSDHLPTYALVNVEFCSLTR